MGKVLSELTPELEQFIAEQPLFYVASAPVSSSGHVNLSPKGLDTFRVLSPRQVAYLDLTGSGNETAAHLTENGRITVMFCSFSHNPQILRLFGRGQVLLPGDSRWPGLSSRFPNLPGARQIILVDLLRIQTSCGFGVPQLDSVQQRDALVRWAESKGPVGLQQYRAEKNALSIDGLPAPSLELGPHKLACGRTCHAEYVSSGTHFA
jgi:hypothetical protein